MPRPSSTSSSRLLSLSPLPAAYWESGVRGILDKETSVIPRHILFLSHDHLHITERIDIRI